MKKWETAERRKIFSRCTFEFIPALDLLKNSGQEKAKRSASRRLIELIASRVHGCMPDASDSTIYR